MNSASSKPASHSQRTENLARSLQPKEIYEWLVTVGYFPEAYVLPPCFSVEKHPPYGKRYFPIKKKYKPAISQLCELHFPKSKLTDRTFSIIDPKIHNDIALEFAQNWNTLLDILFNPDKHIYSYSFPIPIDSSNPGHLGKLRSGRMIYKYLEMAENDLVEIAAPILNSIEIYRKQKMKVACHIILIYLSLNYNFIIEKCDSASLWH